MSGGVQFVHSDDEPLFTGTHDGTDGAAILQDLGALFKSLGVTVGVYVENASRSTYGNVTAVADDTVTVSGVEWYSGDTYNIYKTATKGSTISTMMVDRSRGWQADPKELINGWFPEDVDEDLRHLSAGSDDAPEGSLTTEDDDYITTEDGFYIIEE